MLSYHQQHPDGVKRNYKSFGDDLLEVLPRICYHFFVTTYCNVVVVVVVVWFYDILNKITYFLTLNDFVCGGFMKQIQNYGKINN